MEQITPTFIHVGDIFINPLFIRTIHKATEDEKDVFDVPKDREAVIIEMHGNNSPVVTADEEEVKVVLRYAERYSLLI